MIPPMQNPVPEASAGTSVAQRSLERSLERRREAYASEVRRLIDAAFRLMSDSGRLDPRVEQIVRAAGLSNQAFYRHFRSKSELLLAVLEDGIAQLEGYLSHRMAAAGTPALQVEAWLRGMLAQALRPAAARATRPFASAQGRLVEEFPGEIGALEIRLTAPLRAALEAARDAGELPGCDPEHDGRALYDLGMGWMQRHLRDGAAPSAGDAEALVRFALGGLRRGA